MMTIVCANSLFWHQKNFWRSPIMESLELLIANCFKRLQDSRVEENRLKKKLESIAVEKGAVDQRAHKLALELEEAQKKAILTCQALLSEDKLIKEYTLKESFIRRSEDMIEELQEKNAHELDDLVQTFENLVQQFKDAENREIHRINQEAEKKAYTVSEECETLNLMLRAKSDYVKMKESELRQLFNSKRAEVELKLRVKQAEMEIVLEEAKKDLERRERLYEERLAKEFESLKQGESGWTKKILECEKHSSPERKRPKSSEPGQCLNQSSATGDEPQQGRKKLPVSISFKLDDDDMF